ncbi:TIGR03943 family putative permease subunit [Salipaludibacillus sp. CF4.18]|uniref:TIGR03943 family putative permease subunit n=1 Tax=Salipaludibacillus sp. CF4.18 TaxID=3373081 RepID=UPI003EE543EF
MENHNHDQSFHSYIRGIILLGFALLLLAFILTGNIKHYIAPKMWPFIYFATAVLFFLGALQVLRSARKEDDGEHCDCGADHSMKGSPFVKLLIYAIFVFPIVTGFVLPDKVLDSSVAANRGISYGDGILKKPTTETNATSSSQAENTDEFIEGSESGLESDESFNQYYLDLTQELKDLDTIIVTDDNYLDIMTVLDLHLEQLIGKEIVMEGFVYREADFEEYTLAIARFSMTCCVADAGVFGTIIESDLAPEFDNDTWVEVKGTIDQSTYHEFTIPLIHPQQINTIEEPDQPYVFPTFP